MLPILPHPATKTRLAVVRMFLCVLLLPAFCPTQAQKQSDNWYFGVNAGITFNTGAPTALTNGQMNQREGNATISDANGNLLFYTDGQTIWNSNQLVMLNGTGLYGDNISAQSAIIVPLPGNAFLYYVFTISDWQNTSSIAGLNYSIVDMRLDGGLGGVVTKNTPLNSLCREQIAAVNHGDCQGIWIIAHEQPNNNFVAYLLSPSGVITTPVVSSTGPVNFTNIGVNRYGGLKISSDARRICSAVGGAGTQTVQLYDFDNATGTISNPLIITSAAYPVGDAYSSEFSPDNSKLYVISYTNTYIYQYDMTQGTAAAIMASRVNIGSGSYNKACLQMGPDKKIYVSQDGYNYLGVINNPNGAGAASGFVENGVSLAGRTGRLGLPTFVQTFFSYPYLGHDTAICAGTTLTLNGYLAQGATYLWQDGSVNPTLPVSQPGTYWVETTNNGCSRRDSIIVATYSCTASIPSFIAPDTVCVNSPVAIVNNSIGASTYYWSFCSANLSTTVPANTNLGNLSGTFSQPVFMDYVFTNNNYYGFLINYGTSNLVRLDFGNSLLNTPVAKNLGNFAGALPNGVGGEGIQIVFNEGKWYAIIVADYVSSGGPPRIVKLEFGPNITNPTPIATNWGNLGNMSQPIDLYVFNDNNNWYGFTVNALNSTITRFDFTNSFNNTPTAVNLGNIGTLAYPTGVYAINDNGSWRVFVVNGGNTSRTNGAFSLSRLDFGSSLLNTPTGVNLGSLGNTLQHPRDLTIMKSCGQIVGYVVNGNPNYNDVVRLDFNNNLLSAPSAVSLGNIGGFDFPHSISKLFRVNDELYSFVTTAVGNTLNRLRFPGCSNASIASSTAVNPSSVTYNTPGIYNINLTTDDGLPTQNAYCRQVVVMPALIHHPLKNLVLCQGDSLKIGAGSTGARYLWSDGLTPTDSLVVKAAGTYWVDETNGACSNRDSFIVASVAKPVVSLGNDTTVCAYSTWLLDAGNPGLSYRWQDNSTRQTFAAGQSGTYFVAVTVSGNACTVRDTINLAINPKPQADFSMQPDPCNPLSVSFTNTGTSLPTTWWDFGDGITTTGIANPTHIYTLPGNYTVRFAISTATCTDTVTGTITIGTTLANIITTPDTTICTGSSKKLFAIPALAYCWTPAIYLDNPAIATPTTSTPVKMMYFLNAQVEEANQIVNSDFAFGNTGFTSGYNYKTVNSPGAAGSGEYTITANPSSFNTGFPACKDHTSGNSNMLLINGAATAGVNVWGTTVTVTPNTNYSFSCWVESMNNISPAQLQFSINNKLLGSIFTASATPCSWQQYYTTWNSGTSTTATIALANQNTAITGNDFALDDIGFSRLSIKRDSVIITIDTPMVKATNDTMTCRGTAMQLNASGGTVYTWSPAAGLSNAGIAAPLASPTATTQYIVSGTDQYGCTAKDTLLLTVNQLPTVTHTPDTSICHDKTLQLSAQGGNTYSWLPAASLSNPAIANPVATPPDTTAYTVTVTDANQCSSQAVIVVAVQQVPKFSVNANSIACKGSPVQFLALGGDVYAWSPATGLSDPYAANPVATPTTSTVYQVKIIETTCLDSTVLSTALSILPVPTVTASKSNDIDCAIPMSPLNAAGGLRYYWTPGASLSDSMAANPVAKPTATTMYIVAGIGANGCAGYDSIKVMVNKIGDLLFNIPNAFTPNHDGHNDCFGAGRYTALVSSMEIAVYNRWGTRLFYSTSSQACWDGTYNGKPQDPGGYPYVIKAKTLCGEVIKKGVLILVR